MLRYKKSAIVVLGVAFIYALFWGLDAAYFIFYMLLLTVLISFFWSRSVVRKMEFTQRSENEYGHVGDEINIKTMIYNDSFLPVPCAEIKNEMVGLVTGKEPASSVIALTSFNSRSIYEKFKCKYRGYYNYGPIEVKVEDMFGLFRWRRKVGCEGYLRVFPKIINLTRFDVKPMQTFGTVTKKQKANEDYTNISDIRKYYPGDSFKKIHWKVSARKGSLHVKNYDTSGNAEAYIFLDLYRNSYDDISRADTEEKAVECATAIIHYMLSRNINTGLYEDGGKGVYVRGRDLDELRKFMDELIVARSDGKVPFGELLDSRSRLLPGGSSIVAVTPKIDDSLVLKVVQLEETGFDVTVICITSGEIEDRIIDRINRYRIKLTMIGLNDDIKASLEG